MNNRHWQFTEPLNAIVFDCDSTLSHLEGINELAVINGVGSEVIRLTHEAMETHGITADLYQQRINLVKPSLKQLYQLSQDYYSQRSLDSLEIVKIFLELNKEVFIVSAGLNPAVLMFGELLGVPKKNVYAVDVYFDKNGHYVDYERNNPLTDNGGKPIIVNKIKSRCPRVIHIGDGMNDYELHENVERFIGYGGAAFREGIADKCQYYIKTASLAAVLPLSLTDNEVKKLSTEQRALYLRGIEDIETGKVIVR